jgi:hypothetical protein
MLQKIIIRYSRIASNGWVVQIIRNEWPPAEPMEGRDMKEPGIQILRRELRQTHSSLKQLNAVVQQTLVHLRTAMNLPGHPASCDCYGCNLERASAAAALASSKENVHEIIEKERDAILPK